jgi:hypothetical protein
MKKQLMTFMMLFIASIVMGQQPPVPSDGPLTPVHPNQPQQVYIGLSSGLNYGGLFALSAEFNIVDNLSLATSLGLGTWGFKLGADLRLYKNYSNGLYFVGGFSRATGASVMEVEIETTDGTKNEVTFELLPVNNVNLGLGYAIRLGDRFRLNLEMGYAINVTSGDGYNVTSGHTLSDDSRTVMGILRPGGLRFGLGLNVGI